MLQGVDVRILLRAIERSLRTHSSGCSAVARLGAAVFIHRFGSSANAAVRIERADRAGR